MYLLAGPERASFLAAEQGDAAQGPVVRVPVRLQVDDKDKVLVGALRDRVAGAAVEGARLERRAALLGRHRRHVQDGQGDDDLLGPGLGQDLGLGVPGGPLDVQAVDVDALVGRRLDPVDGLDVGDLGVERDVVEGPALVLVPPGHLLAHGRQEALRVEEPGQPEGRGAPLAQPGGQLLLALDQPVEPGAQGGHGPGQLLAGRRPVPEGGWLLVKDGVQGGLQVGRQDDLAVDRQLHVDQGVADARDRHLQALDLLVQRHVQRDLEAVDGAAQRPQRLGAQHLLQLLLRALRDVAPHVVVLVRLGHELEQLVGLVLDDLLAGLAGAGRPRQLRLRLLDGGDQVDALLGAERQVGVAVQAKDLGRVRLRERVDVIADGAHHVVGALDARHPVHEVARGGERKVVVEAGGGQPLVAVRVEQDAVEVVGDAAAVLDLADHVADGGPVDLGGPEHVLLDERQAGLQVRLVELVRDVPADRAELAALLDGRVQEADGEDQVAPPGRVDPVQAVAVDHGRVRAQQARLHALRRLVRHLDGHLQQRDGEVEVRLARDPQAELGRHLQLLVELLQHGDQLAHEAEAQVAVLQQGPPALLHAVDDALAGVRLLALAHRHAEDGHLLALGQVLQGQGRVRPGRQHQDDGLLVVGHGPDVLERLRHRHGVPLAHDVADEQVRRHRRAVVAERPQQHEAQEGPGAVRGQALLVVRDRALLGRLLVVQLLPEAVVGLDRRQQVGEEVDVLGERHERLPRRRLQPFVGLARRPLQAGAAPQEVRHLGAVDHAGRRTDLQRHHQLEDELVDDEQAAVDVHVDVVGQEVDDVLDALRRQVRLGRLLDRVVEPGQELRQRRLVHGVHRRHVDDDKVDDGAARRHRPVLLALLVDHLLRVDRRRDLLLDLLRLRLGVGQHLDQRRVVEQVALAVRQALQQQLVQVEQRDRVHVDLLDQLLPLLLERALLLVDDPGQELVLEARLRHREVDDGRLGGQLGREVRVAQLRDEVQAEVQREGHDLVAQLDEERPALLGQVALQDRVQHRVQLLLDALDEQGAPLAHAELEQVAQLAVGQRRRALGRHVRRLTAPQPGQGLALRVDQQRPPGRLRHQDAVLYGQVVLGQALRVPLGDGRVRHEELGDLELPGQRDVPLGAVLREVLVAEALAELVVERAAVRDERAGQGAVADQALLDLGEPLRILRPPDALAGQAVDQRVRRRHLVLRRLRRLLDLGLLGHGAREVGLQGVDLGLGARRRLHRLAQLGVRLAQLRLLHLELLELRGDDQRRVVVREHGLDPFAEALGGARHLLGVLGREVLDRQGGEQLERRQEVRVRHQLLGERVVRRRDELRHRLAGLDLERLHRVQAAHQQDQDAVHDALDEVGRRPELRDERNVLLVDGLGGLLGVAQERQRRLQLAVGDGAFRFDVGGRLLARLLDRRRLLLLVVGLLGADLQLGQHGSRVALRFQQVDLLLGQHRLHLLDVLGGLAQLLQAGTHAALLVADLGELRRVERHEVLDERQVRFGRHVHVPTVLAEVLGAGLDDNVVDGADVDGQGLGDVRRAVQLEGRVGQELLADRHERLLRPAQEPVDGAAADQRREPPGALGELVAGRREAEDDVEVVADPVDEELVQVGGRVVEVPHLLLGDGAQLGAHQVALVLREQARDLAGGQHGVDVLEEVLVDDVRVREQERDADALLARQLHQLLDVLLQVVRLVRARQLDLERAVSGDVGGQTRQRLPPAAADADEQGGPARHANDPRDAHQVVDGVLEQDQVHDLVARRLVVLGQERLDALLDDGERRRRLVDLGRQLDDLVGLRVDDVGTQEVDEQQRRRLLLPHFVGAERVARDLVQAGSEPVLVSDRHELVLQDAGALVTPQADQAGGRPAEHVDRGEQDALEDTGQVAHVEQVVELGRRRQHLGLDAQPQADGGVGQGRDDGQQGGDGLEAPAAHGPVDVVDGDARRRRHVEHEEVALETRRDVVAAAARVRHGRHVQQVLDDLPIAALVLVQEVDAAGRHQLPDDLQRRLVAPGVYLGHRQVVEEHGHHAAARRRVRLALALLNVGLNRVLEHAGGRRRRERDLLEHHLVGDERVRVLEHGRRLGGAGAARDQHRPVHVRQRRHEVLGADRVDRGHQDGREGEVVARVRPLWRLPRPPLERLGVDDVVVQRQAVGRVRHGPGRRHARQEPVQLGAVVLLQQAADRPDQRVQEQALDLVGVVHDLALDGRRQQGLDQLEAIRHVLDVRGGHHGRCAARQERQDVALDNVPVEQLRHDRRLVGAARRQPGANERLVPEVLRRHEDDAGPGDGGGRRVAQVLDLEHHAHVVAHRDTVAVRQRQQLVVVEDRVQVLDPDGVDGPVAADPRVVVPRVVVVLEPDRREDAVRPLARDAVVLAEHLLGADRLRIHRHQDVLVAHGRQRFEQHLDGRRLAAAGRPDHHQAVADERRLVQLDGLGHPRFVVHELVGGNGLTHGVLHVRVGGLGRVGLVREQVVQQRYEERDVVGDQLRHVHVAQRPHQEHLLERRLVGAVALVDLDAQVDAGRPQHRQDVPQAKVVVALLGQLLLAEGVQDAELLRQDRELGVPDRRQLDLHDDLAVRHHHGDAAEQGLEVLGQLLAAGVPRVHRDEEPAALVQGDLAGLARELEPVQARPHRVQDRHDLLGDDGQHLQVDAVELVEAPPGAGLAQALVELGRVRVPHLVAAVEHDDVLAQGAAQVLDRLGLARAGGSGRRPAEEHAQGLRQRDVAPVGQRRDDQALLAAQVLVAVVEVDVGDADDAVVVLGDPRAPQLFLPLEVGRRLDHLLLVQRVDHLKLVALVHLDRHERLDLGALHLGGDVADRHGRDLRQHLHLLAQRVLHRRLVAARRLHQRLLHVRRPHELDAQQGDLPGRLSHEALQVVEVEVGELHGGLANNVLHGVPHLLLQLPEPVLDVALGGDVRRQRDALDVLHAVAGRQRLDGDNVVAGELDPIDGVEHLGETGLDGVLVATLRQDDEQGRVRHEVEPRELVALRLQVPVERLLARLQVGEHGRQDVLDVLVLAAGYDVAELLGLGHEPRRPLLVDLEEDARVRRHLPRNVAAREDGLQRHPQQLDLDPRFQHVVDVRQLLEPAGRLLLERLHMAHGQHLAQRRLRLFQLLDDGVDLGSSQDDVAALLPRAELELHRAPQHVRLLQLLLDAELLVGAVADLLNVLAELKQVRLQHRLQLHVGKVGQVELLPGDLRDLLPVPLPDRRLRQLAEQRQNGEEVGDRGRQLLVRVPGLHLLVQLLALGGEHFDVGRHLVDGCDDLGPGDHLVLVDGRQDGLPQRVQRHEQLQLLARPRQVLVLHLGQAEQFLAGIVQVVLAGQVLEFALELVQRHHGVGRRQVGHHRPAAVVLLAELLDVDLELLDVDDEVLLERALQRVDLVEDLFGLVDSGLPVAQQHGTLVHLVLRDDAERQVLLQRVVPFGDGREFHVDPRLDLTDLGQRVHDELQRRHVLDLSGQARREILHLLGQLVEVALDLLVQVLAELELPPVAFVLQLQLEVLRSQVQRHHALEVGQAVDLLLDLDEPVQLDQEIIQDAVLLGDELGVRLLGILDPQPAVLGEPLQVAAHRRLRLLDSASQQQQLDDNALVGRQPVVERDALPRLAFDVVVPVDDLLRAVDDLASRLADRLLDLIERRR